MQACKVCLEQKSGEDFYPNDRTCKECRKRLVRANRAAKLEYYRAYDKKRFRENPKRREAADRYQKTEAGKASSLKAKKRWEEKNAIKKGAAVMVNNAVRDRRLFKASECSQCGKGGKIHGHHDDYAQPLVVRWLCSKCHTNWHLEHGEAANG